MKNVTRESECGLHLRPIFGGACVSKKGREFNVYSVAAIDVFASAMGAFMLIAFIILPFYPNINPEPPRKATQFLSYVIFWDAPGVDIDLHIFEEAPGQPRRRFWFSKNNRSRQHFPDSPAQLSVDVTKGPGVEIWETPAFRDDATYTFAYHYYSAGRSHTGPVEIEGRLYHGEGYHVVKPRKLFYQSERPLVPVVEVQIDEEKRVIARALDGAGNRNAAEL